MNVVEYAQQRIARLRAMRAHDRLLSANKATKYRYQIEKGIDRLRAQQEEEWTAARDTLVRDLSERYAHLQKHAGCGHHHAHAQAVKSQEAKNEREEQIELNQSAAMQRHLAVLNKIQTKNASVAQKPVDTLVRRKLVYKAGREKAHNMTLDIEREKEADRQLQLLLAEQEIRRQQAGNCSKSTRLCKRVTDANHRQQVVPHTVTRHFTQGADGRGTDPAVAVQRANDLSVHQSEQQATTAHKGKQEAQNRGREAEACLQAQHTCQELDERLKHHSRQQVQEGLQQLDAKRTSALHEWRAQVARDNIATSFEQTFVTAPHPNQLTGTATTQRQATAFRSCIASHTSKLLTNTGVTPRMDHPVTPQSVSSLGSGYFEVETSSWGRVDGCRSDSTLGSQHFADSESSGTHRSAKDYAETDANLRSRFSGAAGGGVGDISSGSTGPIFPDEREDSSVVQKVWNDPDRTMLDELEQMRQELGLDDVDSDGGDNKPFTVTASSQASHLSVAPTADTSTSGAATPPSSISDSSNASSIPVNIARVTRQRKCLTQDTVSSTKTSPLPTCHHSCSPDGTSDRIHASEDTTSLSSTDLTSNTSGLLAHLDVLSAKVVDKKSHDSSDEDTSQCSRLQSKEEALVADRLDDVPAFESLSRLHRLKADRGQAEHPQSDLGASFGLSKDHTGTASSNASCYQDPDLTPISPWQSPKKLVLHGMTPCCSSSSTSSSSFQFERPRRHHAPGARALGRSSLDKQILSCITKPLRNQANQPSTDRSNWIPIALKPNQCSLSDTSDDSSLCSVLGKNGNALPSPVRNTGTGAGLATDDTALRIAQLMRDMSNDPDVDAKFLPAGHAASEVDANSSEALSAGEHAALIEHLRRTEGQYGPLLDDISLKSIPFSALEHLLAAGPSSYSSAALMDDEVVVLARALPFGASVGDTSTSGESSGMSVFDR